MKLVATVKDSDYAYIDTFINFLDRIVETIGKLFNVIADAFDRLGKKD